MLNNRLVVSGLEPGSEAQKSGIEIGDIILFCNGRKVYYDLDFAFYEQVKRLELIILRNGLKIKKIINKDKYAPSGIYFNIRVNRCRNKCIFCFVDQMPKGYRSTLYIKDEDIRQSFLFGAYITASDLDEETIGYIYRFKTYPIYISIHSTDQKCREHILGRKEKIPVIEKLKMLKKRKIIFHGQIVLVPDVNDKKLLDKSIEELYGMYPYLKSLAVVPVGLTKYRDNLYPIRAFSDQEIRNIQRQIKKWNRFLLKKIGTRFVFMSDEFFLKTGGNIPGADYYEDFSQISNGVGLVRIFTDEFNNRLYSLNSRLKADRKRGKLCILTGLGFYPVLKRLISKWNRIFDDSVEIKAVDNLFFGESVNVAGLLTYSDMREFILESKAEQVLIPDIILNNENITIDNFSKYDIEDFNNKIRFTGSDAGSLMTILKKRLRRT